MMLAIPVGFQWRNAESGKEWIVTGIRPGGICEIQRVGRVVTGQMNTRSIRAAVDAGVAVPVETSEAGRAILRNNNWR